MSRIHISSWGKNGRISHRKAERRFGGIKKRIDDLIGHPQNSMGFNSIWFISSASSKWCYAIRILYFIIRHSWIVWTKMCLLIDKSMTTDRFPMYDFAFFVHQWKLFVFILFCTDWIECHDGQVCDCVISEELSRQIFWPWIADAGSVLVNCNWKSFCNLIAVFFYFAKLYKSTTLYQETWNILRIYVWSILWLAVKV